MTILQSILAALNWQVRVNENFVAVSPAGMYGRRDAVTTGLTWGYYGGRGFGNTIADGTVTLTASTTNYVVANRSTGAVSVSTATTNWNDATNYYRLYLIVTGASTLTTATDYREFTGGSAGGTFTGGTLTSALNEAPPVTIASAGTVNIGAAASNTVLVSGTTTITAFDSIAAGAIRRVRFLGILQLTHNGTSLILPGSSNITTAAGDVATFESLGSGNWRAVDYARADGTPLAGGGAAPVQSIIIAASDETTVLTTGTAKVTFRMPYAFTLSAVRASLTTAQPSGSIFTVDINEAGSTILSTKITIDNTEKTSTTAAAAPVISDASLADDAEITIDIDQVGTSGATGLKVMLIGTKT